MAAVTVFGCATPDVPDDRFYRVSLPEAASRGSTQLPGVLVVNRFLADGLISERPMVYGPVESPNQLRQYHYDYWVEPPTRMLQEELVRYLRSAGLAEKTVTPELRIRPDFELSGKVRRLEHLRGGPSRVVVDIEFVLRSGRGGLLWVDEYHSEVEVGDSQVPTAVGAFDQAVAEIYASLLSDLRGLDL
jgi:ABC-type uncharacterized transport system auxiliary subunit